jgi:hypothetical protein
MRLLVPRLHALLEMAAHPVASGISLPTAASPSEAGTAAEAEDARQHEAADERECGEPRVVGGEPDGDGTADCDESERGPGWTEVHGDLLVTPVDTTITMAPRCGDGVNAVRRSWARRSLILEKEAAATDFIRSPDALPGRRP